MGKEGKKSKEKDREKDRPPPAPFRPWHAFREATDHGGRTIVFGHWAAQGLFVRPGLRGLDSGCVWGGRLTAWIAEEDRVVSVPAARVYSPTSLPPERTTE